MMKLNGYIIIYICILVGYTIKLYSHISHTKIGKTLLDLDHEIIFVLYIYLMNFSLYAMNP